MLFRHSRTRHNVTEPDLLIWALQIIIGDLKLFKLWVSDENLEISNVKLGATDDTTWNPMQIWGFLPVFLKDKKNPFQHG